ncbi:LOW QUALITY PROTEIN: receptor-type tyrosine-protein phosphatase-like N [Alosa sapidissima]|uniref:LOW QUALITY PROTEIN: receptor-type tyrosine-protein phosphatase-like N n=1 Tax=Alosa sapidissima TaxID=34773 RepID=UPI001C0A5E2C|nr:LOW QUALITY PROTEIN: receptor-type tyrosine-protein phosphatase-like N [Alosa sapidissima]
MRSPRLWVAMCVMTVCYQLGTSSRYGCLFEKRLCPRDQLCSDDGLFGQCRAASQQEVVQYQVSVPVLHRLQEVLKELMVQGLTWKDDITQYIISQELKDVPLAQPPLKPGSSNPDKLSERSESTPKPWRAAPRAQAKQSQPDPNAVQRYLDYTILEPPQSPLHMQSLDPYTYQQYTYQDDQERSLNSVNGGRYPRPSSRSGVSQGARPQDLDRQVLQDLVSLYLSPPAPPASRHRVAAPLSSSSSFFPLDYTEDYISQDLEVSKQQQLDKKAPQDYGPLSELDDDSLQKVSFLLQKYGISLKDLTPDQLESLSEALDMLQVDSMDTDAHAQQGTQGEKNGDSSPKKVLKLTEGSMTHVVEKASAPKPSAPGPQGTPEAPKATPPAPAQATPQGPAAAAPGVLQSKMAAAAPKDEAPSHFREEYGYIVTNQSPLNLYDGVHLLETLARRIHLTPSTFIKISVVGPALTFRVRPNDQNATAQDVSDKAVAEKNFLESETGLTILQAGVGEKNDGRALPVATRVRDGSRWVFLTLVGVACVGGILVGALTIACLRNHARNLASTKLGLGPEAGGVTHFEYQDLCRQHMASKAPLGRAESGMGGAGGAVSAGAPRGAVGGVAGAGGGAGTDTSRVSSVSSQFSDAPQPSPSSHSSTPSWSEEPAQSNMDISTGHMILFMKSICVFAADDHSRVKLKAEGNPSRTDYINASTIIEHDPRMPAYIATQGPLSHTISDFWQMIWESGCTVIVMMTALVEDGEKQCDRYWPDEGSSLYHIYEVNLVSEHIWCNDFLVRSFYLKNVQTQETRTLTQFHFLSWPAQGIPTSTRPLLDFRRKVNKCYRGRSCPIIVHCSDGTGRTGTYILIDMVLNRMAKGVKEIDIAATLEHIRDQRPGMVRTKDQFEFALTAVAEEVNAILKALPQ